ncbi:hypothetical protein [Piscirickettsia litoralis]|uniref:HTH luxR-type domain-containing protein n=1 Tax=Piscirickettsia litoralis TaxID=1891921 RepID=A0ABX3A3M7_9GAMM|nr:hypothetical protein [Piscirickettsia litoralis]ODN41960.1 hypothetical protein BGC07_02030 [Piscirickettsia litoralis]
MLENISNSLLSSEGFTRLYESSLQYSQPIKNLIDRVLINYEVVNFTFVRVYDDESASVITLDRMMVYKLFRSVVEGNDPLLCYGHILPIYDRVDIYPNDVQGKIFQEMGWDVDGLQSVTLEYDLGVYKDTFTFLIKYSDNGKRSLLLSYHVLHNLVIYFYQIFPMVFEYKFYYGKYKSYSSAGFEQATVDRFTPFDYLEKNVRIDKRSNQILQIYCVGARCEKKLAVALNRSVRTVENNIERIKNDLLLSSKKEVEMYLQIYYLEQVQLFLSKN